MTFEEILVFACLALVVTLGAAWSLVAHNHVRCPNCGEDMELVGEEKTSGLPRQFYAKVYKCPRCGFVKKIKGS